MRDGFLALALSLVASGMASPDNRLSERPEGAVVATKMPPLKLDQPDWQPMTGQQISAAFTGRVLTLDDTYRPSPMIRVKTFWRGGCPPSEQFAPNGVWTRYECQRAPKVYSGRWETERFRGGERLCVAAPDFPRLCRFVWLGASSGRIFMAADGLFWDEPMDDPRTFNPYRLVAARE